MRLTTEQVRNDFATRMALQLDEPRRRAFDVWLAEEIRQAKEAAWDEGYSVGYKDYPNAGTTVPVPDNPYWRK